MARRVPFGEHQSRAMLFPDVALGDTVAPGVLLTPPFRARAPWLSGTVAATGARAGAKAGAGASGGGSGPGWIADALDVPADAATRTRAAALADRLCAERLGGCFWGVEPRLPPGRVLVCGAAALRGALAAHDPSALVLVGPGRGLAAAGLRLGCTVLTGPVDPWPLLDAAAAVYAEELESLAVLARLVGVPVAGAPPRDRDQVAAAVLLAGTRYASPFAATRIECEAALDIAAEWRRVCRLNRGVGALAGMSFWKRRRMETFFHDGIRPPPHRRSAAGVRRAAGGKAVAAWSSRIPRGLDPAAGGVLRVEDGFIRSAGLGSGFLPPGSVVADAAGIYYDPSRPSDLETLLRVTEFSPGLLARAGALAGRLVAAGVTKYGAAAEPVHLPDAGARRTILVPGQVADDLSVRLGGGDVGGNRELLRRVRAANPGAFVIYKPHPDVEAGHRAGVVPEADLRRDADLVVRGAPMAALIAAVDEVHTLTSLAGFEALLRRKPVTVYGQPFYAGWGLTVDLVPPPRRGRALSIEELTAGLLLLYARYVDPVTELPCPAEVLLDRIATAGAWPETPLMRLRRWQGQVRAAFARRAARRATTAP